MASLPVAALQGVPERTGVICYVALGANLGDTVAAFKSALSELHGLPGTTVQAISTYYRSAPVQASGPDYTNAVAELRTSLGPMALLQEIQAIERRQGRERLFTNAPRTLDLDLLLYGQGTVYAPSLVIPHPRMWQRAFVVLPLAQLAPHLVSAEALTKVASQLIYPMS